MCLMPSTDKASTMALTPADSEPTVPASPAPFTPSGLVDVGTGLSSIPTLQKSSARAISRRLVEAGFHANWQLLQAECGLCHLMDVQAAISAGDGEATVCEFHVAFSRFHNMSSKRLALGDDLLAHQRDRAAAHCG